MTVYAIAFHLHAADDGESRERFLTAARSESVGPCWDVPEGFVMIASERSADELADALVAATGFDRRRDSLLVMNLSAGKGSAFRGQLGEPELLQLLALR